MTNEEWVFKQLCKVMDHHPDRFRFTKNTKPAFRYIYSEASLEEVTCFCDHLYDILNIQNVDPNKLFKYNTEEKYFSVTGEDIFRLFTDWYFMQGIFLTTFRL